MNVVERFGVVDLEPVPRLESVDSDRYSASGYTGGYRDASQGAFRDHEFELLQYQPVFRRYYFFSYLWLLHNLEWNAPFDAVGEYFVKHFNIDCGVDGNIRLLSAGYAISLDFCDKCAENVASKGMIVYCKALLGEFFQWEPWLVEDD